MKVFRMNEQEFDIKMNEIFNDCNHHLFHGELYDSKVKAQQAMDICKKIISDVDCSDSDLKNKSLIAGIFFKGIKDLIELHELTTSINWITQPKIIEKAWILLCNCKERIDYASKYILSNDLTSLKERIKYYDVCFSEKYGSGIYASPEMLIKSIRCNVCSKDFTMCEHISGAIYNGVLCKGIVEEAIPKGVSIVDKAKDSRCRLWPWNLKETSESDSSYTIRNVVIFTAFTLDDFINSNCEDDC